ncbi:transposase [Aureimonas leprariae]|uniref:Transposase n=1 Tax=Plantimonas leprariae TaxID=2615207 RepID=A0A7V7PLU6_9HYPH|nr:transposase [Aureimonas leprariae]
MCITGVWLCHGRWRDVPPEYGPATTIYNRFSRWSRRGV